MENGAATEEVDRASQPRIWDLCSLPCYDGLAIKSVAVPLFPQNGSQETDDGCMLLATGETATTVAD